LNILFFKQYMMNNYLGNMFAALKNGQMANRAFIFFPKQKKCEDYLKILWNEGFILGYLIENDKIKILLKYIDEKPVINSLNLISKPSRRIYYSIKQIWKINSSQHFIIFSTSKGLKTIIDCKKQKLGGEPVILIN
jgi:small subunit ribosomal protein S8